MRMRRACDEFEEYERNPRVDKSTGGDQKIFLYASKGVRKLGCTGLSEPAVPRDISADLPPCPIHGSVSLFSLLGSGLWPRTGNLPRKVFIRRFRLAALNANPQSVSQESTVSTVYPPLPCCRIMAETILSFRQGTEDGSDYDARGHKCPTRDGTAVCRPVSVCDFATLLDTATHRFTDTPQSALVFD